VFTGYPNICSTYAQCLQVHAGQDQSDGSLLIDPPAIHASIGSCTDVYRPTMDDYRLRVAQGSTGSLL